jgi:two-component system cell cycle sensor histidine kinase/response regulator CckA
LLARALSRDSTRDDDVTVVSLHALQGGRPGALLAANDEEPAPLPADALALPDGAMGRSLSLVAPVFAHGKAYAFTARPGRPFYELYPGRALHRTLGTGFLLTTLLTTLVALLAGRRQHLEQQVEERTRALRASESSYHGLFNFIRQAIYIQDPEGRFLDVNDGAVAMYGYSREEIVGQTPPFLSAPGRNDPAALAARLRAALEGQPQFFEFWGRRRNGEVFPKDVWVCRGTYFGRTVLIAVANDVSDRKRAEADKDRLQSQLVQAQKMESVGRLAGGVAHDFNNMLQAILGNASLALESAPAGDLREYLEEIRRSAQRSADLTRQLLAFASRQTVSPRVIDLNDTISGMLKMLRRLIGEDIQLLWAPGSDLWPVKVDPSQVDQILANLAVNARDAIGGVGRVTIETVNLVCTEGTLPSFPGCAPGEYVMIVVRDTGKGMDEETRAHIFEPFYTTKAPGKGVGLGLATVFGIVKQNHGFIHVQSEPGAGTVFQIGLPRTHLAPEPSPTAMPQARAQGGCETLLLVEDEGSILRFGREALARLGYEVLASSSPREALELARRHPRPIHLLITDVVLPEMNGRELAQTLSAMYPALRCLFMSGYTADVIAERGVLDEHVNFIQKPFHPDALAARIREILDEPGPA